MKNVTWRLYYFVNALQSVTVRYCSYCEYLRGRNIVWGFSTLKKLYMYFAGDTEEAVGQWHSQLC